MDVANQAGAAFRADMNLAFQALVTNSSGSAAPSTTYPYQFWADTNAGLLRMRNGANNAWVTIGLLGVPNFGHILPGTVAFHAKNTPPSGWLKANGGAVSRTTYADLFAEIGTTFGAGDGSTTFNVPELRGEFLRGWDDSRGIDASRAFASAQGFATEVHRHWRNVSHSAEYGYTDRTNNAEDAQGRSGVRTYDSLGSQTDNQSTGTSATETRPRNIALLAIIKF
ncbi:phage tail protein [Cupriavidus sp. 2SB]|uniref:phage tail protein n=1 Tax=Cupriavidus sp. 2SB TaxID=2502199 RepID=UPI00201721B4|nr:phage tail protein [Cupriavidus sp. 2SB]